MTDLFNRNEPIDAVTVANHLKENGQLEQVGGAAYLARLLDVPPAVDAPHYAGIIHDKAVLRRLIEKSNAIAKRCFLEQGNADDIVEFAEASIF
jgi:replicative DNA helicase